MSGVPVPARRVGARPQTTLASDATYLRGAGPALAIRLRALNLARVQDLLYHLPLRYEDRRSVTPVAQAPDGQDVLIRARVKHAEVRFAPRRSLRVVVEDAGTLLLLRFFHFNEAQRQAFVPGAWVQCFGAVRAGAKGCEMVHPEYRLAAEPDQLPVEQRLSPVYPTTTGVTQAKLRALIAQALEVAAADAAFNAELPGIEPPPTLDALRVIHAPASDEDARRLLGMTHPAQRRLIREELLAHQLCMRLLRQAVKKNPAPRVPRLGQAVAELQALLPFRLTGAQARVLVEIGGDLDGERPMLRLIQGDVGSGKTLVAAAAMLATARSGAQAVLMAPTELLAEQHFRNFTRWLEPLGVAVVMLSNRLKKAERDKALEAIASRAARVVIGTHAVFQESVRFAALALVVVDEQHRFGVGQRLALRDKGHGGGAPHQLIMSATPIPRTLAQTVYADLDVSVIDELPPGRKPVATVALSNEKRGDVLRRIGEACASGRQAYWVCTLIEESDDIEAEAAEATAARLRTELPDVRVGLVHGRMKAEQRDAQMRAFQDGHTQLLVATTVIEVGVDVANASIMIIENAERLGLSQLHQLRGRVGRGAVESQCVLLYQAPLSEHARARLEVMRATGDGFVVAQKDLELRGPGEILGRRQTGLIGMKIADVVRDAALIAPLQRLADHWLRDAPARARALIARWVGDVDKYGQV